jgi:N-acetylmuramoyl-L-alanine amidase
VILALAIACVLQGVVASEAPAGQPTILTVRAAGDSHGVRVPLVVRGDGQLVVRADLVATALGGSSKRLSNGHYAVSVPGVTLDIADQSGFATSPAGIVPLPVPATVDHGILYLPLAVVADVLPRVGSGVLYDSAQSELRVFTPLVSPAGRHHGLASHKVFDAGVQRGGAVVETAALPEAEPLPSPAAGRAPPGESPSEDDHDVAGVGASGDELLSGGDDAGPGENPLLGKRYLVVVDAGHGGPDHGMVGPLGAPHTLYEKDITLAVALKVGAALRRRGIDVVQTRTTDTLIALSDRGRIANEHKGDLFLSIHVNAANPNWHDPAAARGFETYFLAEAKTEDARRVERIENEAVRFETGADATQSDPVNFIIDDMHQNEHLRESSELAAIIQQRLGTVHPGPDRGVKQAGFRVLVTAFMPAVLVEIGFGTNKAEARFLSQPSSQATLANAIAGATAEYLARYARRVRTAAQ